MSEQGRKSSIINVEYSLRPFDGIHQFNLDELKTLFSYRKNGANEPSIRRQRRAKTGWLGAISASRTTTLNCSGLKARNSHIEGWLGIKNSDYKSSLNLQSVTGVNLLSLCAYLGKLKPDLPTPNLVLERKDALPSRVSCTNPFNIKKTQIYEKPKALLSKGDNEHCVVGSFVSLELLPESIDRQCQVAASLNDDPSIAEAVYGLYGTTRENIEYLWQEAMSKSSPNQAGEAIQIALS
jgi:hypothetical protein